MTEAEIRAGGPPRQSSAFFDTQRLTEAFRAKRLGHGSVVRLAADFHPSRRRRGKSGKDSRVGASRPWVSSAISVGLKICTQGWPFRVKNSTVRAGSMVHE